MLSSVKDNPEVQLIPAVLREEPLEVFLDLLDRLAWAELPALREAMDVGIHRESRHAESLCHDDGGGLMPDARQLFEFLERAGHLAPMLRHEHLTQPDEGLGFLWSEPQLADQRQDPRLGHGRHLRGRAGLGEECRGDFVDLLVRALGRKHHRDQERIGIRVVQRDRRRRVELRELPPRLIGSFLLGHESTMGAAGLMATHHLPMTYSQGLEWVAKPYAETVIL